MTTSLVRVPFHGDTLEAVQRGDTVWVSIRRICENLEIDAETQRRKLKVAAWAVAGEMPATGADGKTYSMSMLALKSVPMWLATIYPQKVKEQVREKLARYQQECADVLAAHFLGGPKPAPGTVSLDDVRAIVVAVLQEALPPVLAQIGTGPRLPGPFWTVASWLEENMPEWDTTRAQRHQIGQEAKRRVERAHPAGVVGYYNRDLAFLAGQLDHLARAAQKVRRKAELEGKARTAPRLFDPNAA